MVYNKGLPSVVKMPRSWSTGETVSSYVHLRFHIPLTLFIGDP